MSVFNTVISERRTDERHPFRTQVQILLPGGQQLIGHTIDIGKGGMGMVADINPPAGFGLRVRMSLPLRSKGSAPFEAQASVANSVLAGKEGGFRIGLKFESLDSAAQTALAGVLPK